MKLNKFKSGLSVSLNEMSSIYLIFGSNFDRFLQEINLISQIVWIYDKNILIYFIFFAFTFLSFFLIDGEHLDNQIPDPLAEVREMKWKE